MMLFTQQKRTLLLTAVIALSIGSGAAFDQTDTESAADSIAVTDTIDPDPADAEAPQSYRIAVNFEENSLELTPLSSTALDSMSALFARSRRNRYEVHGYSCPNAGGQNVIRLSTQRVERMVDHLISIGIPGENILTVVNAPKSGSVGADKRCTEDRQVDIISSGLRWREREVVVVPEQPKPPAPEAPDLRAEVMEPLKEKLAELEPLPSPEPPVEPKPVPPEPITAKENKMTVAVYMAGTEPLNAVGVHTIVGGELARVLSESDKYTAVDRTVAILEQLNREHAYQRSGAVDDDQIKAIGHQLGVQYLCISNINPVGRRYYLDTRLVDIVTAEIARSVTATSSLKDADEMTRVGRNIALELLEAEKTRQQRALRKKLFRYTAIGLDMLGVGTLAYGCIENSNVVKHTKRIDEIGRGHITNGPEAERAATRRDVAYIVGGVLVASGVTIHIVF